jgi:diguanylate cyclase (GGDEF)-like protein/PAS domain S-box-containing protein
VVAAAVESVDLAPYFRAMFEHAPVAMAVCGFDGRFLAVNDGLTELLGFSGSALLEMNYFDVSNPDETAAEMPSFDALARGEIERAEFEKRFRRPDGRDVISVLKVSTLPDAGGRPQALIGHLEDVTGQRMAEAALARSQRRLATIMNAVPVGIAELGPDLIARECNPAMLELIGRSEIASDGPLAPVHPEDVETVTFEVQDALATRSTFDVRFRLLRPDGTEVWVRTVGRPIYGDDGSIDRVIAVTSDIALERDLERLSRLIEALPEVAALVNARGCITYLNPAGQLLGTAVDGDEFRVLLTEDAVARWDDDAWPSLIRNGYWIGDLEFAYADSAMPVTVTLQRQYESSDDQWSVSVVAHDISELKHTATHDTLTGIPNRALFLEELERACARAERSGDNLAVLFVDLDGFKQVNDQHGHAAGDEVLRTVAQRLHASVRRGDLVGRLGGDEFVVLCAPIQEQNCAVIVAETILDRVREPIEFEGATTGVGCSIGVATLTHGMTADELVQLADTAAYEAKRAGKGRFVVADSQRSSALATADANRSGVSTIG